MGDALRRLSDSPFLISQLLLAFALFGMHHGLGLWRTQGAYSPFSAGPTISAQVFDETHLYAPGATRFWKQSALPSEVDVYELKDRLNGYPIAHSVLIGGLAKIFGSIEVGWMVAQAGFAVFVWFLFWYILRQFGAGSFYSAAGAWIGCLFAFSPRHSLLQGTDVFYQPIELTRLPHPALSFALLLCAVLLVSRVKWEGSRRAALITGVACGGIFYTYYFYWNAFFLGLGAIGVSALIRREWRQTAGWLIFAAGSAIGGTPYFWRVFSGLQQGDQKTLMGRVGDFTTYVYPASMRYLLFALLGFVVWRAWVEKRTFYRRLPPEGQALALILVSLLLGAGLGLNLQAVTGYNAQHSHYFNRLIQPVGILLVLALLGAAPFWARRWLAAGAGVFAVVLIGLGGYRQWRCSQATWADHRSNSDERELLAWLGARGDAGDVVGTTDLKLNALIPTLAGTWNFVPIADRSMGSYQEIIDRYVVISKLEGKNLDEMLAKLSERGDDDSRLWRHALYQLLQRYSLDPAVLAEFAQSWHRVDPDVALKTRRLDYLIVPAGSRARAVNAGAREVFRNESWAVLRLKG